ncbi:DeoR/GlpR family DNA-binding transcription regulator [Izhakiella capsodis]|uniref:DeoR/GlpR family DNA-binding transcription regulator n=1 Tax=Izhakiella capsodis TaxID=1367852 RepID=UPI001E64B925|nr:DeoR/GlpR family DNA-binding transcription regulator [Izhakiella capsodis]
MPRKSSNLLKRRLKIAELVGRQGEIKVDDLSALLGVTGVTIRGDLNYLEQQGYLKRSFGGAIATPAVSALPSKYESSVSVQPVDLLHKLEIARQCTRLISDEETVFLGQGETCRRIIPFLCEKKKLRLIVNDLQHVLLAEQYLHGKIIVAGDEVIRPESLLTGQAFDDVIQRSTIDHCILEVSPPGANGGLMINQSLLASSYQRCFDKAANIISIFDPVCEISGTASMIGNICQVKNLVTCRFINEQYQQFLSEVGFNICYSNNECFTWSNRNLSGE